MELFTRSQAAEMLGITVRKLDELRAQRRFGQRATNFASLGDSLKIPSGREAEYTMPSVMYQ